MNLHELDRYKLSDAVKFNARLNPKLWGQDEHLKPQVRDALMKIADDFRESLGVKDLDLKDITLSGSNAAYTYTPNSDIDLHLVVDIPDDEVYRELFDAKKYSYNNQHNIRIGGYDVELYVQDVDQPHVTQGEYSLLGNDWIQVPRRQRADVVDQSTRSKYQDLKQRIKDAVKTEDHAVMADLMAKIRQLRQSGLDQHGEFGPENLAFKMLRTQGYIQQLVDARNAAKDQELSIDERAKPHVTYGFTTEYEDGLQDTINQFARSCIEYLGIKKSPRIELHTNTDWSEQTGSFGQYEPETNVLHLATAGRHTLDILRTMAHEFTHRKQAEKETLPDNAGETGSPYEDQANAMAGRIMRYWAEKHPEMFAHVPLEEASGYIPTKKQARDPRFVMALTRDVRPGAVGKEANKLGLQTDAQGRPALLTAKLNESLAEELVQFKQQDLFEINMGSKNLRREAARTGAIAGMEFEMIVPNVEGDPGDEDLEPDYDYDQRCRSIQDAYDFFYDGDFNSRRSCDEMRDSMRNDYTEWLDQKISDDWDSGGEEYIYQWVKENVDESEWNPEEKSDLERTEALEEYATNVHADPVSDQYQTAYEEFREENQESYDESDWLDDADLSSMREIGDTYSMDWPHWSSPYSGGEAEISDVAQEFENAIGRDVRASDNYHSGSTLRPSVANQRYIVEPDGSLEADNPGDRGLEFVSPPLPIDEILSDLNKVRAWAKEYGCYTNDSTGLHINISVPDYSREKLDFVKLALLMGDRYVLDAFGRTGNTYAKSAMGIIKDAVRNKPEDAARLLDKMKGNLDQLATKAIHSGITSKYTSINTKDGHIEFRSPGGDWLGDNFNQIENTLLRFTVAMSAALNPDAYREEYLKKLYKLLSENNKDEDTIKYFADYVAGKIPQAALRSFVKQAQLQRNIKRGKTDGQKMWWKVYKDGKNAGRYSATVEVVATSEKEAIEKAAKEWGEPLLVNTLARMDAEPLRPYVEQPGGGTYELFDRRTGETIPDTEFSARNQSDVNTRVDDYVNHGQHGMDTVDARLLFGARPVDSNSATRPYVVTMPANPNFRLPVTASSSEEAIQLIRDGDPDLRFADLEARPVSAPADDADQDAASNPLRPTGPGPWEVYNRQTGNSTVNLIQDGQPITDRAQAQRQAMALISTGRHDLYGVRTIGTGTRANIGTQTDMENRLGLPSQSVTANYAVVDRFNTNPVFRFQADDRRDANRIYGEWLAAAGLPATTEDYGFQEIRPESVAQRPSEIERDWRIVDRETDETLNTVRGASQDQALAVRDDTARRHGVDARQLSLQVIFNPVAAQQEIPEVPLDIEQNFPQDRTDGRNTDYSFRDLFGNTDQASSAPAGNSFSGQWQVMIDGEEVWRFRGPANGGQADANRIAQLWLRDQRSQGLLSPAPGADVEVVPIMVEGIEESFSQGVAEGVYRGDWVRHPDNPWQIGQIQSIDNGQAVVTWKKTDKRKKAMSSTHAVDALQHARREFSQLTQPTHTPGMAEGKVKLHTDPGYFGAEVDDTGFDSLPVVNIPTNQLVGFEPDSKMNQPKSQANVEKIVAGLKKGDKLPPLLVRKYKNGYQVLDGHHRFWAYKLSGTKSIPVRIVADKDIEEISKQGVAEGESNDTAISLSKLGKFHPGADTLAQFVPERATAQYALHPDKWESTFYSLTNKDSDKLKYYGPKKISIPPGTLVGDMAIANKFYRAKTTEEKQQYAEAYKASLQPYPVDVSEYRMPELLMPMQDVAEDNALTEIEHMKQSHFTGGKDMLGSFQKPGKKHLKPLPGGTDLMYSVTKDNYGSYVYIVDPGVPGITKNSIVASLSLIDSNLPNTFQVGTITVDEDYRGRGLARALYGIVLTIMRKNLVSGSSQTPGGRRNWLSLASIPGVEVKGLVYLRNRDTDTTVGDPKSRYNKYVEKTIDRVMELGGQFVSKEKNYNYWAFDVVPGKGQLQPAVQNALSKLYGYDSDALLMATWTGA